MNGIGEYRPADGGQFRELREKMEEEHEKLHNRVTKLALQVTAVAAKQTLLLWLAGAILAAVLASYLDGKR